VADNKLAKVAPTVTSLARPETKYLLAARTVIQRTPAIQEIFQKARDEHWDIDQLALQLEEPLQQQLECSGAEVVEVSRYLADEYAQMGDTILVISRETGKAIGKIDDDDVWLPEPVPREGGGLAQPLARLNPQLEAFLVSWHFERGREQKVTTELAERVVQTELQKAEGDQRFLPVSKKGRSFIVAQVRERLPQLLSETKSGTVGEFLRYFDILEEDPPTGTLFEPLLRCVAISHSRTGIQDLKAMNLRYNRVGALCGRISGEWGRHIAQTLSLAAQDHFKPAPQPYHTLEGSAFEGINLWVMDPDTAEAMGRDVLPPGSRVLPVAGAPTLGIKGKIGAIVIKPNSYQCQGRELFDRWEVAALFEYTLWVDWASVVSYDLTEVPISGFSILG
jgi:hypothetical protein